MAITGAIAVALNGFEAKVTTNKAALTDTHQQKADQITGAAIRRGDPIFAEIFAPIQAMAARAGSLAELEETLERDGGFDKLLDACESDKLTALLADAMLAADLEGRLRVRDG